MRNHGEQLEMPELQPIADQRLRLQEMWAERLNDPANSIILQCSNFLVQIITLWLLPVQMSFLNRLQQPALHWLNSPASMQLYQKQRESRGDEEAMSYASPHVDLLVPSSLHTCSVCSVSLANLTRIVARRKNMGSEGGFCNYCLACFSAWPSNQSKKAQQYEYFTVPSPSMESDESGWTVLELCSLLECVERFGIDSWANVHKQFVQKTGSQRLQIELAEKYKQIYNFHPDQFSYQRNTEWNVVDQKPQQKPHYCSPNISKFKPSDQPYAWQFYDILKQSNIIESSDYTVDNHHDYLLKVLLQNQQITKQSNPLNQNEEMTSFMAKSLTYAKKWMENSLNHERVTHKIQKNLCRIYIDMCKRKNRSKRELIEPEEMKTGEGLESHPELKRLRKLPEVGGMIEQACKLMARRNVLRSSQRAMKGQQREQADQADESRQHTRTRAANRNKKKQSQSFDFSQEQCNSPRPMTRSFQK